MCDLVEELNNCTGCLCSKRIFLFAKQYFFINNDLVYRFWVWSEYDLFEVKNIYSHLRNIVVDSCRVLFELLFKVLSINCGLIMELLLYI